MPVSHNQCYDLTICGEKMQKSLCAPISEAQNDPHIISSDSAAATAAEIESLAEFWQVLQDDLIIHLRIQNSMYAKSYYRRFPKPDIRDRVSFSNSRKPDSRISRDGNK